MRPQHPQAPLTDEQRELASSIELARRQNVRNLDKAVLMIELRKWCVERAVEGCPNGDALGFIVDGQQERPVGDRTAVRVQFAVMALANDILAFVSAPLQE
jgi:hypothetical protein